DSGRGRSGVGVPGADRDRGRLGCAPTGLRPTSGSGGRRGQRVGVGAGRRDGGMSLFVAELRRLSKRRFAQLMAVLVVLLLATVVAIMAATHYKPGPEARARAEARAAAQYEEDQRWLEQGLAQCEAYW